MSKSKITKTWVAGVAVFAAGIVVAIAGVFVLLAYGGTFTQIGSSFSTSSSNYHFTANMNGSFWTGFGVIVLGGVIALIGAIVQLVAYIGGLVNSYWLPDRTWFAVMLVGGLLSLAFTPIGLALMVAYVIAAPDGSEYRLAPTGPATPQRGPLAPTS